MRNIAAFLFALGALGSSMGCEPLDESDVVGSDAEEELGESDNALCPIFAHPADQFFLDCELSSCSPWRNAAADSYDTGFSECDRYYTEEINYSLNTYWQGDKGSFGIIPRYAPTSEGACLSTAVYGRIWKQASQGAPWTMEKYIAPHAGKWKLKPGYQNQYYCSFNMATFSESTYALRFSGAAYGVNWYTGDRVYMPVKVLKYSCSGPLGEACGPDTYAYINQYE